MAHSCNIYQAATICWALLGTESRVMNRKIFALTEAVQILPKYHKIMNMKGKVKVKSLSRVQLFATPWTVAYQAPPSMGFSRQEYWSELPFPSPGDLPDSGTEPRSPAMQADSLPSEPPGSTTCDLMDQNHQGNSPGICLIKMAFS